MQLANLIFRTLEPMPNAFVGRGTATSRGEDPSERLESIREPKRELKRWQEEQGT